MKQKLNGTWQGRCLNGGTEEFTFKGKVPGCVHTDLMGKRIPKDLQKGKNAEQCQWIEERDWEYSRTFVPRRTDFTHLVFEGLDTYAEVYLNGVHIGSADDMFITHRFCVEGLLKEGENTLTVSFRSPVKEVEGLPERKAAFGNYERLYTRRMQCTYGWDWVERFITCGIWRDVYLERKNGITAKSVYVVTEAIFNAYSAQLLIDAELENYEQGGIVRMEIRNPAGKVVYANRWYRKEPRLRVRVQLRWTELWYPAGYGRQPLYTVRIGGLEERFGIRTVRIEQLPDEKGSDYYNLCRKLKKTPSGKKYDHNKEFSSFRLVVNGKPIFCRGANWVPSEPFPSAETDKKQETLLKLAVDCGVNMLRVWGGGIFERKRFYELCDELGILVTQDFLMACGDYPSDDGFIEKLQKETEAAALALRNHPCLMWWSGDNENAVLGCDTADSYRGRDAIFRGIEPVLSRLDPARPFMLSSPCGGNTYASKTVGTTHNTQFLGTEIFPAIWDTDLRDLKKLFARLSARFIAEEPVFGAASTPSLQRFMSSEDILEGDDMWQYHTKGNPALKFTLFDMLQTFSRKVLGEFTDGYDRLFKLKYAQYEWLRLSFEQARRNEGFCNGMIYWMWNDCWAAAAGWSLVDYYCVPKAGFYSFKRCAWEVLLSADKNGVWVSNRGTFPKTVHVMIVTFNDDLTVLDMGMVSRKVDCDSVMHVVTPLELSMLHKTKLWLYRTEFDSTFYCSKPYKLVPCQVIIRQEELLSPLMADPRTLPLPPVEKVVTFPAANTRGTLTVYDRDERTITVLAGDNYVHAVELEGDFLFEDNYFPLMPCELKTVRIRPLAECRSDEITVNAYTLDLR